MKTVRFITDLILVAIFAGMGYLIGLDTGMPVEIAMFIGGLPFGWRWASKVITAISFAGVLEKAAISVFVGMIALPVTLLLDFIRLFTGRRAEAAAA